MKIKTLFVAGILGIAVVAGVFDALMSPRKKDAAGGKKKEEEKTAEGGNCDGL